MKREDTFCEKGKQLANWMGWVYFREFVESSGTGYIILLGGIEDSTKSQIPGLLPLSEDDYSKNRFYILESQ